jgi:hypothetical protein
MDGISPWVEIPPPQPMSKSATALAHPRMEETPIPTIP